MLGIDVRVINVPGSVLTMADALSRQNVVDEESELGEAPWAPLESWSDLRELRVALTTVPSETLQTIVAKQEEWLADVIQAKHSSLTCVDERRHFKRASDEGRR